MTKSREQEFDFSLVLSGIDELRPEFVDALFEAGCDDATVSMVNRAVVVEFSRQAPSFKDAVLSAIRDVHKAGAEVAYVAECNLVTQAEIARRINRSRQFVYQLITGRRGPGGFPLPVCHMTDDTPLWQWCAVSFWLAQNNMIRPEESEQSKVTAAINTILELSSFKRQDPRLIKDITKELNDISCT